jgi:two-component system sensor histidine kinase PhoQ
MSPGSGLYAQVTSNNGRHAWRSPSMAELKIDLIRKLKPSTHLFQRLIGPHGNEYYAFAISVTLSEDPQQAYTFSVAEDMRKMRAEIGAFRQRLFTLLGGLALVLLIMQIVILHWGLAPLRQAAQDLTAIESGDRRKLQGAYPREIRGLTDNINALLETQHEHLERYRNTLGDLAHSLKTPLTVIRNVVASRNHGADVAGIEEQVNRMSQIIDYQLQRAATSGRMPLSAPVSVAQTTQKIMHSLNKVYADKRVHLQQDIPQDLAFHGDEGDLYELLGNLLDNAYKACRRHVKITATLMTEMEKETLQLIIEDDGPGIMPGITQEILKRGIKGNNTAPGHGIGLAVVQDIVRIYNGRLDIGAGALGGARFHIQLPMQ